MSRNKGWHTDDGGKQVDTDESLFDWVDGLVLATLYFISALSVIGAVMWVFHYFWG